MWLSPHTTVMPGWVRPNCGPTTHNPFDLRRPGADRHPELRAVGAQRLHLGARNGIPIGLSTSRVGTLWDPRWPASDPACARRGRWPAVRRRPVDWSPRESGAGRCRAGPAHLGTAHDMRVPYLLRKRRTCPPSPCVPQSGIVVSPWRKRLTRSGRWSRQGDPDALEVGPQDLNDLSVLTGQPRATPPTGIRAGWPRWVDKDDSGRYTIGPRLHELSAASSGDRLRTVALLTLRRLRDDTGESAQIYRRKGNRRPCVASVEPATGLRDTVPEGAVLTMSASPPHKSSQRGRTARPLSTPRFSTRCATAAGRTVWPSASPVSPASRRRFFRRTCDRRGEHLPADRPSDQTPRSAIRHPGPGCCREVERELDA